MGKDVKRRFTVSLDIDTKDAEKQIKSTVGNLKTILAELGSASDKMTYFKELADYLSQIDAQLDAFKQKYGEGIFNQMFGGLDESLRKEFEGVFGVAKEQLTALEQLKEKVAAVKSNGTATGADLKPLEQEVKSLYESIGMLDKLDLSGKGKVETRIKKLEAALNGFAVVWDGVNDKIKQGFNFGETGGGFGQNNDNVDNIVNKLQSVKSIVESINNFEPIDLDFEITIESANKLIEKFKELNTEREALIVNGDMESEKYASIYAEQAKIAAQLIELRERLMSNGFTQEQMKPISNFIDTEKNNVEGILEEFLEDVDELSSNFNNLTSTAGNGLNQIGEFADGAKSKIDSLNQSLQDILISASQLEVDTRNNKATGKETMNLFDGNGIISQVDGADYQVDTDALVQQLLTNLKQNIVMSLHNHANGLDVFSPSDVESFAKLYYGQGTKINGIIANGIVKTIDFSGISQEVAIKIAQSYSENIKYFTSRYADYFSFNNGEFDLTDKVKQLEITNPSQYAQIASSAIDGINACLNDAFIKNGVEPTIQVFQKEELPQLAKYLSDIEQSGQNAIDPIEKLKNLITTLNPNQTFDWSQFTDIFDKFKSGAIDGSQALNQILNFKTVAADAEIATASIDQAETKVKEFLALADEIYNKSFDNTWDATDNVEIGKYTERLNSAKAALDELGDQGQLTAEQLEQVNNAFNQATKDLDINTKTYDAYASDSSSLSSYYDDYLDAQEKVDQLESENKKLQEQLNQSIQKTLYETPDGQLSFFENMSDSAQRAEKDVASVVEEVKKLDTLDGQLSFDDILGGNEGQSSETSQLNTLQEKLIEVKSAVEQKTEAFKNEKEAVDQYVSEEIVQLNQLLKTLQQVSIELNSILESFTKANSEIAELKGTKEIDVKENITSETAANKAKEIVSQDYALDKTLVETNGILNQILAAIGNNESLTKMVEPLNAAVAELKNVANGIVQYQQAQKTDLSAASSRIANNYGQLSSISSNAVAGMGTEIQIKGMKALADNIVRVEGAVKGANGVWTGFITDINEANQATIVNTNSQSEFAKALNKTAEAAKQVSNETKTAQDNKFTTSLKEQTDSFNEYRKNLKDVSYISDDLKTKLDELGVSLHQVTDTTELNAWKNSFSNVQKQITLAKDTFTAQQVGQVNQAKQVLEASFKTLDFKRTDNNLTDEQQKLVDGYKQAAAALKAYQQSAQQGNQIEVGTLQSVTSELYKQIEAYKQRNNIVDAGGGNKKAYGTNAVASAKSKYNSLSQLANEEYADSAVVQKALSQYTAAYQKLIDKQKEYKVGQKLDTDQEAEFKQLQAACNGYARELDKLINSSKKFAESAQNVTGVDEDFKDTIEGRKKALQDYVQVQYGASAKIGEFKKDWNELTFAIDNGNGTFTQMTAAINPARNAIGAIAGDTKKATSAFGQFFDELKGKFKTISTYLISSFSLQEVWQQIRQGVNYVREIDSALTELKKVTDETDESYSKFLKTMSKTASEVGSTVKDLTNSAADWSRLGYSMEEAGELAATTAKLLNVSEFESVDDATSALVSSLQAFTEEGQDVGQRAEEIVDVLNNIGNRYPVATNELADGLATSSAALVAANNSIEEQVALLSAGNATMQDISTVASGLKIVAARLRGTTTDIDDDTDSAITNVSKLQAKIKALTKEANGGEGIDIINEQGEYKSTYEILLEISKIFDKMDDVSSASLLELIAGKNRSSVVAAILQNTEILEGAYNDALDSAGSAENELNTYLDSIQGRIDLFTNSLQTMWMNFINSDAIKFIVDLGSAVLKLVDAMGVIPTVVGGFTVFKSAAADIKKEFDAINNGAIKPVEIFKDDGTLDKVANGINNITKAKTQDADASKVASEASEEYHQISMDEIVANTDRAESTNEATAAKTQDVAVTNASTAGRTAETGAIVANTAATKANIIATKALSAAKAIGIGIIKGLLAALAAKVITAGISAISKGSDNVIHRA